MTRVTIREENDRVSFRAEGHAGFSAGDDIVCSAVSMLSQAFYETMDTIYSADIKDGHLEFEAEVSDDLKGAVTMARTGFRMLAEAYPEYVSFRG